MEIEVKIKSNDILDETEIKYIVEDEIRKAVRLNNTTENIAYYIKGLMIQDEVKEHLPAIKEKVRDAVSALEIDKYDLDRKSKISDIIEDILNSRESEIREKVNKTLDEQLEKDDFYDEFEYRAIGKITENLSHEIYNTIIAKFKK